MPTPIDSRRLRDATAGEKLDDPATLDEARATLSQLHDAICASQSLDDLGPEGNRAAWAQMERLSEKERRIKAAWPDAAVPRATGAGT